MVTTSTLPPVRGIGAPRTQGRKPATDRKAGGLKSGATGGTKLAKAPAPAASKPVFQSAYQGGPAVEIFSAGGTNPASDWKVSGNVLRCYDKTVRGYVFAVDGSASTRMQLPKDTRGTLGLTQRFLVLQLHCPCNRPFSVELGVTDTDRTRRRLLLSTAFRDIVRNPLHAQIPLTLDRIRGCWANLCFDLVALVEASFQAQPFRTLDFICLGPTCKLRKIFTLKGAPIESEVVRGASSSTLAYADVSEIPRSLSFPLMLEPHPVTWIFQPSQPAASPGRDPAPPLSLQGMQIGSPRARNTVRTIKPAAAIHSPVPAAAASPAAEAASPLKSQLPAARRALMALKQKHAVARATTPRLPHPSQTSPQPTLSPQRSLSPPAAAVPLSVLLEDDGAAGGQAEAVLEKAVSPQPSPRSRSRTPRQLPSFIDMPLSGRRIPISARIAMSADASLTQRTPRGLTNQTSVPEQQHRPRSLSSPAMATRSPGRVLNSTTPRRSVLLKDESTQGKEQEHAQVEEEGGASPTGSHFSSQQVMPNLFSLHESTDSVEEYLREAMVTELGPASAEPEDPPTSISFEELTAEAGALESTSPVRSIDGHSFCAARSEGPQSVDSGKLGYDLDLSLTGDVREVDVVGDDQGSLIGEDQAEDVQGEEIHMTVCHEADARLAEPRTATPSPRSSPLTAKDTYPMCGADTPPPPAIKHTTPSAERGSPREVASPSPRAKLEVEDKNGDVQLLEVDVAEEKVEEAVEKAPLLAHAPARESKEHLDVASPRTDIAAVESVYRPPSSSGRRRPRVPSSQADASPRLATSPPLSCRSRPGSRLGVQRLDEVPPRSKTPPTVRPTSRSDSSEHHLQPQISHRLGVGSPRLAVEQAHVASPTRTASLSAPHAAVGGVDVEEPEIVGVVPRPAGDEAEGVGVGQTDDGHGVRPLSASPRRPTRTEGLEEVRPESRSRALSRGAKIDDDDDIDELLSFGDDLSLYQERKLELEDLEESFRQEFGELDGLSGTPRYQTPSPAILAKLDHDDRQKGGKVRSRSCTPTDVAAVQIERGAADGSSAHDEAKPTRHCSPDVRDKVETALHGEQRSTCTAGGWPESKDNGDKAQEAQASVAESDDDLVDLLYCPSLNCYVSPATGKYYELL